MSSTDTTGKTSIDELIATLEKSKSHTYIVYSSECFIKSFHWPYITEHKQHYCVVQKWEMGIHGKVSL